MSEIESSESVLHRNISCRGVDTRPVLNREEHLHPIDVRKEKKIQVTKEKRGDSNESRGYQEHKDTSCVDLITIHRGLSPDKRLISIASFNLFYIFIFFLFLIFVKKYVA